MNFTSTFNITNPGLTTNSTAPTQSPSSDPSHCLTSMEKTYIECSDFDLKDPNKKLPELCEKAYNSAIQDCLAVDENQNPRCLDSFTTLLNLPDGGCTNMYDISFIIDELLNQDTSGSSEYPATICDTQTYMKCTEELGEHLSCVFNQPNQSKNLCSREPSLSPSKSQAPTESQTPSEKPSLSPSPTITNAPTEGPTRRPCPFPYPWWCSPNRYPSPPTPPSARPPAPYKRDDSGVTTFGMTAAGVFFLVVALTAIRHNWNADDATVATSGSDSDHDNFDNNLEVEMV